MWFNAVDEAWTHVYYMNQLCCVTCVILLNNVLKLESVFFTLEGFPGRILSEVEVALVNSGLLSPCSNECSPQIDPDANPDIFAAFPHSPLSPVSTQPVPSSPSMGGTPRLYPILEPENLDYGEYGVLDSPTYAQPIGLTRTNSDINMTRVMCKFICKIRIIVHVFIYRNILSKLKQL